MHSRRARVQAGLLLRRGTGEWVVDSEKTSFLWKTWSSHEDFITWQWADDLPRLFGGLNFFEPVPAVSRLVFQVTDLGARKSDGTPVHPLKDSFFRAPSIILASICFDTTAYAAYQALFILQGATVFALFSASELSTCLDTMCDLVRYIHRAFLTARRPYSI